MGACTFITTATGPTARDAFRDARDMARRDLERDPDFDGDPSSGSVAGKGSFTMIARDASLEPYEQAERMIDAQDPRVDDKRGPAGCLDLGSDTWMFFG